MENKDGFQEMTEEEYKQEMGGAAPVEEEEEVEEVEEVEEEVNEEETGSIVEEPQDNPKKQRYFIIFAKEPQEARDIGYKNVGMTIAASKNELKKLSLTIVQNGMHIVEIIKGRTLSFNIKVEEIKTLQIGG